MGRRNHERVIEIYQEHELPKWTGTLNGIAYRNPHFEIPNAFGKQEDDYRRVIDIIVETVPKALDRILHE